MIVLVLVEFVFEPLVTIQVELLHSSWRTVANVLRGSICPRFWFLAPKPIPFMAAWIKDLSFWVPEPSDVRGAACGVLKGGGKGGGEGYLRHLGEPRGDLGE